MCHLHDRADGADRASAGVRALLRHGHVGDHGFSLERRVRAGGYGGPRSADAGVGAKMTCGGGGGRVSR